MDALREHEDLEFLIIGVGQQAEEAARWLHAHPRLTWWRDCQSPEELTDQLAQADICLGIFGGGGKASRVLLFKMSLAMAEGKDIITPEAQIRRETEMKNVGTSVIGPGVA